MKPTELTKQYVISNYVNPARLKGEKTIQVRVGNLQKELGWTNRTPSVFSTLLSKDFQQEAGVELIEKRGGPPSGGRAQPGNLSFAWWMKLTQLHRPQKWFRMERADGSIWNFR